MNAVCDCGQPATVRSVGRDWVCKSCAAKSGHGKTSQPLKSAKLRTRKLGRSLAERLADPSETNGRGWGSLDVLERRLANL